MSSRKETPEASTCLLSLGHVFQLAALYKFWSRIIFVCNMYMNSNIKTIAKINATQKKNSPLSRFFGYQLNSDALFNLYF